MVLVATAVTFLAKRFGSPRDSDDAGVQGDHPFVRALFGGAATGETAPFVEFIGEDCQFFINGRPVEQEDGAPDPVTLAIERLQEAGDLHWVLYDELTEKESGRETVAIRFVSEFELDGNDEELEVAAFVVLDDDKVVEWREIHEMSAYNTRLAAAGLPPIESGGP